MCHWKGAGISVMPIVSSLGFNGQEILLLHNSKHINGGLEKSFFFYEESRARSSPAAARN